VVGVIQETKHTKLHDSDAHKHRNLVPVKHVLVFACLQYFTHATLVVSRTYEGIYIQF